MKSESAEEAAGPPIPTKGSTGEAALKCLRPEVAASTAPLNFTGVGRPGQSGETLQPARSRARGRSTSLQLKECAQRETTQRTPSPAASSRIPTRQWGTPSHQRAMVRGEGNQSNRGGGETRVWQHPRPRHIISRTKLLIRQSGELPGSEGCERGHRLQPSLGHSGGGLVIDLPRILHLAGVRERPPPPTGDVDQPGRGGCCLPTSPAYLTCRNAILILQPQFNSRVDAGLTRAIPRRCPSVLFQRARPH